MKEFALALSAMTASHHRWPLKPPLEPVAIVRHTSADTRRAHDGHLADVWRTYGSHVAVA